MVVQVSLVKEYKTNLGFEYIILCNLISNSSRMKCFEFQIDKATILSEAITHVKRLKERVRELEEQRKKTRVESVSFVHQRSHIATVKGTTSGAMNSDECCRTNEALPTVEARVFKKDVLLRIHCKIQSGILIKILDHLNSLDLSTISNSVMPFGSSTLDISIIAQVHQNH